MNNKNNNRNENKVEVIIPLIKLTLLIICIVLISSISVTALEQNISSCRTISTSGIYTLNQSITSTGTCMNITADNIILDCKGNTILYNTNGVSTGIGINAINTTIAKTNLTIKNCIIIKPSALQTSGYGIMLSRYSNSYLINNTIYTNGTTNNYGIYLTTNSLNNTIEQNRIYSGGNSTGNIGLYLLSNSGNNTIINNIISTNGTTTSYGILIQTNSNQNIIENNTIFTFGSSSTTTTNSHGIYLTSGVNNTLIIKNNITTNGRNDNYGIYLLTNVFNSNISNNNIATGGTLTTNYGIYLAAATNNWVNNNIISNNIISTNGTASNYGIYLYRNTNNNSIFNNQIYTRGTTTNYGLYLLGVANGPVNNNSVYSNTIYTSGTAATSNNHGIILNTNANFNNITFNNVYVSGTTSYGVYLSGGTLAVEQNNINSNIISVNGTSTNNFGVYFYIRVNKNNLLNNTISTYGTSTNHGIYIYGTTFDSSENNISLNRISTNGTAGSNYGIHLYRNVTSNTIQNNNISTSGTTANYGIYGIGATNLPVDNNKIYSNIINASGTAVTSTNYGIHFSSNTNNNTISDNNIYTNGTTANYGIYILGTSTLTAFNNTIYSNTIRISGTTTNNYGIYLATNTKFNNISRNNILTQGTTGNIGIAISGATISSTNNTLSENTIQTSGTTTSYGIYLTTNATNNNIYKNNISTKGTTTNYGIYLLGSAGNPIKENLILSNTINTNCTAASSSCYGIFLQNLIYQNNLSDNNITTKGTGLDFGVYLFGTGPLPVDSNLIDSNKIEVSTADAIRINTGATNNTLKNNLLINNNQTNYDINIISAQTNGTQFVNQQFQRYNFGGTGEIIKIQNPNFGEIEFSERINGSGNSFSNAVNISQNYVYINSSSQQGLNKSATITLYNVYFASPLILIDGETCLDCSIISNVNGIIKFNVPHFSSYSVGSNSLLEIFDDLDLATTYNSFKFYANYTNRTNNNPITNGLCSITFSNNTEIMTYNASYGTYVYYSTLSAGIHYYNITCSATGYETLNLTDYANIPAFDGPHGANITIINSSRAKLSNTPSSIYITAGNTSQVMLNTTMITSSWQGYYGSVKNQIFLANQEGSNFFSWNNTNPKGEIYATRTPAVNFVGISCSTPAQIASEETFIGHDSSATDSVSNTFDNNNHPEFNVGQILINSNACYSTNLYSNGRAQTSDFYQILLSDGASNIIYTSIIDYNKTGFNNNIYDFQMIVGENGYDEVTTPYYFFVEIT